MAAYEHVERQTAKSGGAKSAVRVLMEARQMVHRLVTTSGVRAIIRFLRLLDRSKAVGAKILDFVLVGPAGLEPATRPL
jgi:hypothetical protein